MKMLEIVLPERSDRSVLDPFMGSGSTAVACAKMGIAFTGIELDPDFFELSCQRVRDAITQPDMFAAPAPQQQAALL